MRRQARISVGGALVVRSASALQVWLWLLIFIFQNEFRISRSMSIQPGYLDFDNLPDTNFTCAGKVIGGYYADTETSCQMFHVCTVGAENETMDIKFLCLNGTVFDQETRVCERVDEVDCTKSEKFYSLNLELYGSTLPPIIEPEQDKPQAEQTEQSQQEQKPNQEESDPSIVETSSSSQDKQQVHQSDTIDSTEDPVQEIVQEEPQIVHVPVVSQFLEHKEPSEENHEEGEIENENPEYDEVYTRPPSTTTQVPRTSTTTTKQPQTIISSEPSSSRVPSLESHVTTITSPTFSSLSPPLPTTVSPAPSLDPSLLSPQEFINRHRGPGSEAISFQRQSIRPADGVYITHAPPLQFDPFQYESSRTAPRPTAFVQRPQPSPFRTTTVDPRDQLLRPGSTTQSTDRHPATSNRSPYPPSLPAQNFPFDPFYYDHKRSDDSAGDTVVENESFLAARSVAPPHGIERHTPKIKSPPRVIVTASASVSDSSGRKLNYTVGNVVSAVQPNVHINYDNYKESDVDPFFLDVPKLKRRRKSRSNRNKNLVTVPAITTVSSDTVRDRTPVRNSTVISRATTTDKPSTTTPTSTVAWNPNDYVDDNYEPHAYVPPVHPHALLVDKEQNNHNTVDILSNSHSESRGQKLKVSHIEEVRSTLSVAQTTSSHSADSSSTSSPASSPPHRRSSHGTSRSHHAPH